MRCFRCESDQLEVAAISESEAEWHPRAGIRLLVCTVCNMFQNHQDVDDPESLVWPIGVEA